MVGLLDIFELDSCTFATVLELCEGGDLDSHLQNHHVSLEHRAQTSCLLGGEQVARAVITLQLQANLAELHAPNLLCIHVRALGTLTASFMPQHAITVGMHASHDLSWSALLAGFGRAVQGLALGLLLGTEAPVMTPSGADLSFPLFLSAGCTCRAIIYHACCVRPCLDDRSLCQTLT